MAKGALRFKNMTVPKQQGELGRLRALGGPDSGVVFVITGQRVTVGRGEENDVILTDLKTSRRHAEVTIGPVGALLRDMGSSHGLLVNGIQQKQVQLRNGDKIGLGETVLEFIGSEAGATRMIVAPPNKTASVVGTGSSGLTQFIPKPSVQQPKAGGLGFGAGPVGGTGRGKPASFLEKNKKMIAILGVLMGLAAMLPEVEQKQKAKKKKYLDPMELEASRGLGSLGPAPVDPATAKAADVQFKECFREFRARNYLRAQVSCETALQIYNDHALARIYLESTKKEMENEAKDHFTAAKRDEEANRLHDALNRYGAVKRLYAKDQSNPLYKEADARALDVEKKMKEGDK